MAHIIEQKVIKFKESPFAKFWNRKLLALEWIRIKRDHLSDDQLLDEVSRVLCGAKVTIRKFTWSDNEVHYELSVGSNRKHQDWMKDDSTIDSNR